MITSQLISRYLQMAALVTAAGLEDASEGSKDSVSPDNKKEEEEKVIKQVPSLNCATVEMVAVPLTVALLDVQKNEEVPTPIQKKAEKMEALKFSTSQKENDLTVNTREEINRELVGKVCSPTTPENKVKFKPIVV